MHMYFSECMHLRQRKVVPMQRGFPLELLSPDDVEAEGSLMWIGVLLEFILKPAHTYRSSGRQRLV